MPSSATRSKRFNVSVTPEAYDIIKQAADGAGVSVSAWSAITLTQTANHAIQSRDALLEAAKQSLRELIGKQDVLPVLLAAQMEMAEEEGEGAS